MNESSFKRRVLAHVPGFSRLIKSIEALQAENRHIRQVLSAAVTENQRLTRLLAAVSEPDLESDAPQDTDTLDGLALPPARLRYWVSGTDDVAWFIEGGARAATTVVETLAGQGVHFGQLGHVLDFGCGCGRVLRALRSHDSVRLHGTDCNATAIAWCDRHLPFAEFSTNTLAPPTRYRRHSFDLIYAFSVLTHLPESLQRPWMEEFHRILRPDGLLLFSVHGDYYADQLDADARTRYDAGALAVVAADKPGANECAAFHPHAYVRDTLAAGFDILASVPEGALGNPRQDLYLIRARP